MRDPNGRQASTEFSLQFSLLFLGVMERKVHLGRQLDRGPTVAALQERSAVTVDQGRGNSHSSHQRCHLDKVYGVLQEGLADATDIGREPGGAMRCPRPGQPE